MRIFEPHAHMTSRTTDDYEAMAASGVKVLVEPAFWLGQPRTSAGSFVDYFNSLLGWERFRASQFGIRHHCTIGLNPKEANDDALRREVLDLLPRFLAKDGVVAVGEIGFDAMTPAEHNSGIKSESETKEYGVAFGGPIMQDRMHFFLTYEAKRYITPVTVIPGTVGAGPIAGPPGRGCRPRRCRPGSDRSARRCAAWRSARAARPRIRQRSSPHRRGSWPRPHAPPLAAPQ